MYFVILPRDSAIPCPNYCDIDFLNKKYLCKIYKTMPYANNK